jgi:hypothetical protein
MCGMPRGPEAGGVAGQAPTGQPDVLCAVVNRGMIGAVRNLAPMTPSATLRLAGDLLSQADKVREDHPDVADALAGHSEALIDSISDGGLSIAEVAILLGQSRPTIYEWVKSGYLVAGEARTGGMTVSPRSLLSLIPILDQWREEGRGGRPSRLFREWLDAEAALRNRRRASAALRREHLVANRSGQDRTEPAAEP